jgi:hypothetical protein
MPGLALWAASRPGRRLPIIKDARRTLVRGASVAYSSPSPKALFLLRKRAVGRKAKRAKASEARTKLTAYIHFEKQI